MPILLKSIVKPSDFNLKSGFRGSSLQIFLKEWVAKNIVAISLKGGDQWFDFSFEDYKIRCKYGPDSTIAAEEGHILNLLVADGVLDKVDDAYSVNEKFFRVLATFIK